jgi:hypothetical protein
MAKSASSRLALLATIQHRIRKHLSRRDFRPAQMDILKSAIACPHVSGQADFECRFDTIHLTVDVCVDHVEQKTMLQIPC